MAYPPGTVFAGFVLQRVLGAGGMGTVYLARHPRLPRFSALKLLSPELSHDPDFRRRFEQEAELAARLNHPNVVSVHDRGIDWDQLWIDMQYIEGVDCAEALARSGPMAVHRALRIVTEVGKGLDYAHRLGLLHRDVKPGNILLAPTHDPDDPERVLLTDFGVAKAVDTANRLTSTGSVVATLAYAAPEQIQAGPLDHRVDVYALGCVVYELLTGHVPFPGGTAYEIMGHHLTKAPPQPTDLVPGLPRGFDEVVATALAKNREDRYGSCRELTNAAWRAVRAAPTGPSRGGVPVPPAAFAPAPGFAPPPPPPPPP
ncbi:MAG: serine/threonine protein kinase, partial [Actinomycetota bacterium]|nr:serine/threonine protein kinase [Actinomycetota bacterium]